MKVRFLGGTGTVTGSKYLVSDRENLLVDCGLFQGLKDLRLRNWAPLPFDPSQLDAIVLTHAHLDHSGYIPLIVKSGFDGPIYCTGATFELCRILLPDSGYLQEEDAAYANKRGYSRHRPALPLYTQADAEASLKRFVPIRFDEGFKAASFDVTLRPAGHILGAASAIIRAGGCSILFSGDLGRYDDPVMRPPPVREPADYVVIESTYGNRVHPTENPLDALEKVIGKTIARRGVVVVPSFAVGRAQALSYLISVLKNRVRIPKDLPIYLNSPMAADVTEIYHRFRTEHRLSEKECGDMCTVATIVNSAEESKALNLRTGPMVIISASGMATGGRVLHHLRAFAPDPNNTILLTGFQAAGTRGAALRDGAKVIRIHGADVPVAARVEMLDGLSAHGDCNELLRWLGSNPRAPRRVFVTHGEQRASEALKDRVKADLGWGCDVPGDGSEAVLD